MRLVVALGGNALSTRGTELNGESQRASIRIAAESLAEILAAGHQPVITHGNGPQVGYLALHGGAFPLDVLGADAYLMLIDVEGVFTDFGTPKQALMSRATPQELRQQSFPAGSMGPKVAAACDFVDATAGFAAIGRLTDTMGLIEGTCGTVIDPEG